MVEQETRCLAMFVSMYRWKGREMQCCLKMQIKCTFSGELSRVSLVVFTDLLSEKNTNRKEIKTQCLFLKVTVDS